jgi:hypothetical protein
MRSFATLRLVGLDLALVDLGEGRGPVDLDERELPIRGGPAGPRLVSESGKNVLEISCIFCIRSFM